MPLQLVIFDCDGVLFDSEHANVAFYQEVLRLCGEPPLSQTDEAECHALATAQLFEKFYGDRPELLQRLVSAARQLDYGPFYPLMRPRHRLREILTELRTSYRTAMATNRGMTTRGVLAFFELADLFDLAVGVLDVPRPKPHPDMLERCLEHFGLRGQDAVYIGDQPGDQQSAVSAGIRFIGIGPMAERAELSIASLAELPELLARL
ncbi:MAG TPA: HAD family hydrolase [Candidatus Limnocylindrales bacterium]|nr:HAD family hydrolase [Candidatus Limnocylindrales bacterium]